MDDVAESPPSEPAGRGPTTPPRPHAWLKSLTFSDGTRLEMGHDEIVVVVGPNNAGKSAALRETHRELLQGAKGLGKVVLATELELEGSGDDVEAWLDATAPRNADGNYRVNLIGAVAPGTVKSIWKNHARNGLQGLANLLTVHLNTEARLLAANPVDLVNFANEAPTHPLHQLYQDEDELEARLDRIFRSAFGESLVVNRGAGRQVMLQVGNRPSPPEGKDRQSNEFRTAVNNMPALHEQGDGMRGFVGVVASVLAADRDITFIDEPEAFLHPPQAVMLGRVLADETPTNHQLLAATHSTDFLKGVLDHASPRVRVVRLTRKGNNNQITELSPDVVRKVWSDPLLRYSRVLDGLFHDGVIVCEGDADCRFYGAMMDAVADPETAPDLLLVYGAGKSRIATIVKALRAIGVPVRVVADFDALADEQELDKIVLALGGDWSSTQAQVHHVRSAIDQRRAQLSRQDVRKGLLDIIDASSGPALSDKEVASARSVLRGGSAWAEAKRLGKAFVPGGQLSAEYEELAEKLRKMGLHLVEVGELESFCKPVEGHGPAWVAGVLERQLKTDPDLAAARQFATTLLEGWN